MFQCKDFFLKIFFSCLFINLSFLGKNNQIKFYKCIDLNKNLLIHDHKLNTIKIINKYLKKRYFLYNVH